MIVYPMGGRGLSKSFHGHVDADMHFKMEGRIHHGLEAGMVLFAEEVSNMEGLKTDRSPDEVRRSQFPLWKVFAVHLG